jgi:hypothetical protein
MEYNREEARGCGSVLTLIKEPSVAAEVGKVRLDGTEQTSAYWQGVERYIDFFLLSGLIWAGGSGRWTSTVLTCI